MSTLTGREGSDTRSTVRTQAQQCQPVKIASGSEVFSSLGLTRGLREKTMRTKSKVFCRSTLAVLLALAGVLPGFAQDGKLAIHAPPKQAYVFVDDHAMGEASRHRSLKLSPGD